jgi:hypothetical protein
MATLTTTPLTAHQTGLLHDAMTTHAGEVPSWRTTMVTIEILLARGLIVNDYRVRSPDARHAHKERIKATVAAAHALLPEQWHEAFAALRRASQFERELQIRVYWVTEKAMAWHAEQFPPSPQA